MNKMDLWIRTQDKEDLVKANALYVMNNQIWNEVPFYENHKKIGLTITGHNHKLAEYSTKERALEVLDEIHDRIATLTTIDLMGVNDANLKVFNKYLKEKPCSVIYQMPEE